MERSQQRAGTGTTPSNSDEYCWRPWPRLDRRANQLCNGAADPASRNSSVDPKTATTISGARNRRCDGNGRVRRKSSSDFTGRAAAASTSDAA